MKYTREQFIKTLQCFDITIKTANEVRHPVDFDCYPYHKKRACPHYCPVVHGQCLEMLPANRWQSLKEQFIAEHEPKD